VLLRIFHTLFVRAFFVSDKFQEKRNVIATALIADALDPGVLFVVYILRIKWRVIEQDFHTIGTSFLQALCRPMVKKISEAARAGLVIPGFLIRQQQACILGA